MLLVYPILVLRTLESTFQAQQMKSEQNDDTPHVQLTTQLSVRTSPMPGMEPSSFNTTSDSSSIRSRRSSSIRQSDCDKSNNVPNDQQQMHGSVHHHHHHYYHCHHHLSLQTSDVSWDEDTSSTSGYRESYSIQLVSLESSNNNTRPIQAPPLASPDLNDMPSTSSTTTNVIAFDGSSPDCSINGSGGEKTALLTSSQRTTSQHSLLIVFPNQDEDTLI